MNCDEKLPPGWIRVKSKSRPGKEYFFNKETNSSCWKVEDLKKFGRVESPIKKLSPKKASLTTRLSDQSKVIKKNVARDRMTKLQSSLQKDMKREAQIKKPIVRPGSLKERKPCHAMKGSLKDPGKIDKKNIASQRLNKLKAALIEDAKKETGEGVKKVNNDDTKESNVIVKLPASRLAVLKPKVPFKSINDEVKNIIKKPKLNPEQNPKPKSEECTDVDMLDLSCQESAQLGRKQESAQLGRKEQLEPYEAMEWEDVPEHEVIIGVQKIRTFENEHRSSTLISTAKKERILSKTEFYIIVDTNVLLSNIDFIKDIKGKLFKDIGKATIYLPYIVLCELDKIKSYNDKLAMLARRAVAFIDDCFVKKDPYMVGQSGKESFQKQIIPIDSGDDEILNCCLHIQEITEKMILLTNDRNLRNKAFVNKIEAYSRDTLNFVDFNDKNDIKFDGL